MPYLISSIDTLFRVQVRKEYTQNLEGGHGEYIAGDAVGLRVVRGQSLVFQVILDSGAAFRLPIEALCHRPCEAPASTECVQPWDCLSSDFGVASFAPVARGAMLILPSRVKAQYRFTVDFTGSDLADDPVQGKCLHVAYLENGWIGAFPNNRVLWVDPALRDVPVEIPRLRSLGYEFRAEGFQDIFGSPQRRRMPAAVEKVTPAPQPDAPPRDVQYTDPADAPDWVQRLNGANGAA